MKLLVIGSGGREHTLLWKLHNEGNEVFAIPGNGGISEIAKCEEINITDFSSVINFVKDNNIELTVVGPEAPLVDGIVDEFNKHHLKIFGPTKKAAKIEGSKIFAKELLSKQNVATAKFIVFDNSSAAIHYIEKQSFPIVIKADGLAAGKGTIIAKDKKEAIDTIEKIMDEKIFGSAGERIIIEDYLQGEEFSFKVFTDGEVILPMAPATDYKRLYDNDRGPNTGGMGCFSPVAYVKEEIYEVSMSIMQKIISALQKEGIRYKGVLYGGFILTKAGVEVLEFNCRFGDPETQVVLPRISNNSRLTDVIEAVVEERLNEVGINFSDNVCVCVVLASGGYPDKYEKGKEVTGLNEVKKLKDILVFHAGTKKENNKFITAGGRVLGVCAINKTFPATINKVYNAITYLHFDKMHYRKDIAQKAIV